MKLSRLTQLVTTSAGGVIRQDKRQHRTLSPHTFCSQRPHALALALGMALSPAVWAQPAQQKASEKAPENASPDSTATVLGDVVVKAGPGPLVTSRVLSSVNIIPSERLQSQGTPNNWQLFEKAPGVMLTTFGQGTTSGKLSFRAFNGEGEINAVKLLIDGIPSNSNDGNMPYIDLAPRLDIESVEIVRGTNDPRYGLHNMAGNVNIVTKSGGDYKLGRTASAATAHAKLRPLSGSRAKASRKTTPSRTTSPTANATMLRRTASASRASGFSVHRTATAKSA